MADSGDGWVHCTCSDRRHWGVHGAAGLLLVSDGWIALQQRSPGSHHGGEWSLPCGAMRSGETAEEAAVREAVEEVAVDPGRIDLVGSHVDQHDDWSYTTVFAAHQGAGNLRPVAETAAGHIAVTPTGTAVKGPGTAATGQQGYRDHLLPGGMVRAHVSPDQRNLEDDQTFLDKHREGISARSRTSGTSTSTR